MRRANAFCGTGVDDSEAIEKILGEAAEAGEIRSLRD
jgi:hypothetical protein